MKNYLCLFLLAILPACKPSTDSAQSLIDQANKAHDSTKLVLLTEAIKIAHQNKDVIGESKANFFIGYYYESKRNYKVADSLYRISYKLALKENEPAMMVTSLNSLGLVLTYTRKLQEAERVLKEALGVCQEFELNTYKGYIHKSLGVLYDRKSDIQNSIVEFTQAVEIFIETNNYPLAVETYNYIGSKYKDLGAYELSANTYLEAAQIALNQQDTSQYISSIYQSATNLIQNNNYRESIELSKRAQKLLFLHPDSSKLSRVENNIGEAYLGLYENTLKSEYLDSASYLFFSSNKIKRNLNDKRGLAFSQLNLGRLASSLGDKVKAESYFNEALDYWVEMRDTIMIIEAKLVLAKHQAHYGNVISNQISELEVLMKKTNHQGQIKLFELKASNALIERNINSYSLFITKRDSIKVNVESFSKRQSIASTEVKLRTAELSHINKELEIEAAYQERLALLRKYLLIGLIILFIAVVFFTLIIRNRNKSLKQLNIKIINLKNSILHSQSNSFSLFSAILNIQAKTANPNEVSVFQKVNNQLNGLTGLTRSLYEEQFNSETGSTNISLETYLLDILNDTFPLSPVELKRHINIQPIEISSRSALNIGLIVQELVLNTIKHAVPKANEILLNITQFDKSNLLIEYQDNGPGLSSGLGSKLINILTDDLRGKVEIENKNGLKYKITIPV